MTVTVDAYFPVRVTTIAERDAQPMVEGLRCFVHETLSEYVYNSGVWVLVVTAITPETQTALDGKANSLTADQNYVTDAQLIVVGNTSSTNTGDNSTNSQYSGLAASKQDTLVSAANIKTINGSTVLGSGDLVVGGAAAWGAITGTLSSQTDLQSALDAKADDLGVDDNYVTDAEKVVVGNTSGTNSGDNATNSQYSGLAASKENTGVAAGLITTHEGAADPHTVYQKESEKGSVSGYAGLDAASKVPTANLGGAGASGSNYLRGDQTWATPAGGGITTLRTTSDQTINSGAAVFVNITGLTFAVTSGVDYAFHFYITFRSAATTTGWKSGVNHPGGTLDFWAKSDVIANGAAGVATHTERHNVAVDDMTLLTATITQNVDLSIIIEGRYKCTSNGTFAARFANELAANTQLVVQKGSWGWYF